MNQQEIIMRLSILQEESKKVEEQIQIINNQILEFNHIADGLEKIGKNEEKEILAGIGKGIYIKSEIKDKKLFVNIGNNVVLRKSIKETKEIIEKQINQMNEIKEHFINEADKINLQLRYLVDMAKKVEDKN